MSIGIRALIVCMLFGVAACVQVPVAKSPAPAARGSAQSAPARGGRGEAPVPGGKEEAIRELARQRMARRTDGPGGAPAARNATLEQLLAPTNYAPAQALGRRLAEINTLKYAFVDRQTGEVVLVGAYDPAYATGPIPYQALLADALENPYPRFTLDYPGSSRSSVGQMRQTLDREFARISQDTAYGVQWLERLMLPVLKGEAADPDQQAALDARLTAAGIAPAHYRAFLRWQASKFNDMKAYAEGGREFLPSLLQAGGGSRQTGYEIAAYRAYASDPTRERLEAWCVQAGRLEMLHEIDRKVRAGGSKKDGVKVLLPALYTSMLRGLGVPEPQLTRMTQAFQSGRGGEELFVQPLDQKYPELFKRVLTTKVVNGMVITSGTLARLYNVPAIQTPLNTYGARRDSPLMQLFFKADYTLKFLTSSPRPAARVPQHQTSQEFLHAAESRAGGAAGRTPATGVIRYWLSPQAVELDVLEGHAGVRFRAARLKVGVESLEAQGADRRGEEFHNKSLAQYSAHLTERYDQYARVYPSLHSLREAEKVIALVRWAQAVGVPLRAAADATPRVALPEAAEGFWGMTYLVRPKGDTDTMVLWAQGGVDFGQTAGGGWLHAAPPDRQVTDDTLRQLAASTALAEKAAAVAKDGNLESARELAERSAQAMTGSIDLSGLPRVPMPTGPVPAVATAATVSQAAIVVTDANVRGLQEAKATLGRAAALRATDPAQAAQLEAQGTGLQQRAEANLTRLQEMLQQYRTHLGLGPQLAVDLRGLDPHTPVTVAPARAPSAAAPSPAAAQAPCPAGLERTIPSRQQLQTELAARRGELDSLKGSLLRLNRAIQLDQQQYAQWEAEAQAAVTRLKRRIFDLGTKAAFDSFIEISKWYYPKAPLLTPQQRQEQLRKVEFLKNLKDFSDYQEWALTHKNDWEKMDEGFRQAVGLLPLTPTGSLLVQSAQYLVDSAFDVTDWVVTWDNLQQLDRNSTQFLETVRKSGERMRSVVGRIQEIETQLAAAPAPPGASPCRPTEARPAAR